ncbi:helix-turn-helix domain-containing protein [Lacticaseibacillus brantae]|uniref:Mga helix-turn-helix domain-containing protein n=1 Tax=Lacticaseibacillus brantae DSM 23927 TaxID=1423727 RepID=A0A0R2B5L2_9LACO|nr:helix-turn-helix domain-containing protein [Lacticaseibacillus brantae]KRM71739.1 hypothetical protein FC34_GL001398 [Lacticaseibacillus brantae DSM 23927]
MTLEQVLMTKREEEKLILLSEIIEAEGCFRLAAYAQKAHLSYATAYNLNRELQNDLAKMKLRIDQDDVIARYRQFLIRDSLAAQYILWGLMNQGKAQGDVFAKAHGVSSVTLRRRLKPFQGYVTSLGLRWSFATVRITGNELFVQEIYARLLRASGIDDSTAIEPQMPLTIARTWLALLLGISEANLDNYDLTNFLRVIYLTLLRRDNLTGQLILPLGSLSASDQIVFINHLIQQFGMGTEPAKRLLYSLRYQLFIDPQFALLTRQINPERSLQYWQEFGQAILKGPLTQLSETEQTLSWGAVMGHILVKHALPLGPKLRPDQQADLIEFVKTAVKPQYAVQILPVVQANRELTPHRASLKRIDLFFSPQAVTIDQSVIHQLFDHFANIQWLFTPQTVLAHAKTHNYVVVVESGDYTPLNHQVDASKVFEWVPELGSRRNLDRLFSMIIAALHVER